MATKSNYLSDNKARIEFRTQCSEWLTSLGYTEIYSINHPTPSNDEVHFVAGGHRVRCFFTAYDSYCKVVTNTIEPISRTVTISSMKIGIGDTLDLRLSIARVKECIRRVKPTGIKDRIINFFTKA